MPSSPYSPGRGIPLFRWNTMTSRWNAAVRMQRTWRRYHSARFTRVLHELTRLSECVVCGDECVHCVRCPNNHPCCVGCHVQMVTDSRCPLCREPRRNTPGHELKTLLTESNLRLVCRTCGTHTRASDHEYHRDWCHRHEFLCPFGMCSHQCTLGDMRRHVLTHEVDILSPPSFEITLAFTKGSPVCFFVGDVLVVLSSTPWEWTRRMGLLDAPNCIPIYMRAYYPSPLHAALFCNIRHFRLATLASEHSEHFAYGPIPPVLASREHAVLTNRVPVLVPFCHIGQQAPATWSPAHFANRAPDRAMQTTFGNLGIRDLSIVTDPFVPHEATRTVGLLHLQFHTNGDIPIGPLYRV